MKPHPFTLIKVESDEYNAHRIEVIRNKMSIALIFCDGTLELDNTAYSVAELKQLLTIAENFNLIFSNL